MHVPSHSPRSQRATSPLPVPSLTFNAHEPKSLNKPANPQTDLNSIPILTAPHHRKEPRLYKVKSKNAEQRYQQMIQRQSYLLTKGRRKALPKQQ